LGDPLSVRGALITKSADQTAVNATGGHIPTFNTSVYDTDSIVQSNQYFQIPAGLNNLYGIFTLTLSFSSATAGDGYQCWLPQNGNGSLFSGSFVWKGIPITGGKLAGNGQASTASWLTMSTGPVLLATSDRYEGTFQNLTDTSITIEQESSFGLLVLESFADGYCIAKLAGDLTGVDYSTPTAIAWNGADIRDSHGTHSATITNTKFVIPAALNNKYVMVGANIYATGVTGTSAFSVAIRMNGSLTYTGFSGASPQSPTTGISTTAGATCRTQAIQVVTGDEFETLVYCADTSIDISSARSNMYMYVVA
jgi:hypothetical protein